jgi:MSHA biogenesis protein MshN
VLQHGRELAPAHRGFAKAQARLLMARGEPEGALQVLEQAAPSTQEDPEYRALAAALYQRQGKHAAAIEEYRELLRYNSRQAVWWMGLAISYEGQGRSEKALVAYRTAAAVGGLGEDSRRYVAERIQSLEQPGD